MTALQTLDVIDLDEPKKHPKCRGYRDWTTMEFDCGYWTNVMCEECRYGPFGIGRGYTSRKDPEAKCNEA